MPSSKIGWVAWRKRLFLAQGTDGTFKYSLEIRIAAAGILSKKLGKVLDWNLDNTNHIKDKLNAIITKALWQEH